MHYFDYLHYTNYFDNVYNAGWLKSVGSQIIYELDHKKPVLYAIPIEHILVKLPVVPVGQFSTTFTTSFRAPPATAGRMLAMDARCGLSTLGPWAGPVICNEWNGRLQHGKMFLQ
jgi:hypothetical protein